MHEFLFESQKLKLKDQTEVQLIDQKRQKELEIALLNAIIIDGRTFKDFCKPGMSMFLQLAIPGN